MRGYAALLSVVLLPLGSCAKGSCGAGTVATESGCRIERPAPCDAGTVRASDGSCKTPYGYEVRDGERMDAPEGGLPDVDTEPPGEDDTDEVIGDDTAIGDTWEIDLDTDVPFDSAEPSEFEPCDYELRIRTVSWAEEIGFEFRYDGDTLFSIVPGDLAFNDQTYDWPLPNVGVGTYQAVQFDSAGDGWHGGYFEIVHLASGAVIASSGLDGRTMTQDVFLSCGAVF